MYVLRTDVSQKWLRGLAFAQGQNFARRLKETPANLMTPTIFSEEIVKSFSQLQGCTVTVRYKIIFFVVVISLYIIYLTVNIFFTYSSR